MRLLILLVLPSLAAGLGQSLRSIRIITTALGISALIAELVVLRSIGPEDTLSIGVIGLSVSPLSSLFLSLIIVLIGVIILYNHGTRNDGLTAAALLLLSAVTAVLILNNLFIVILLIEMTSVGTVLFTAGSRPTRTGLNATIRYLVAVIVASVCLVFGFLLMDVYRLSTENLILARLVLALLVIGFGIRLAGFPFHFWLPDFSHHAPPMVTALLISILSLTVLVVLIVVLNTFPWLLAEEEGRALLMAGGIAGALLGAIIALGQSSINRLLAYSTISDIGLIVFGLGTLSTLGLAGAIFQAINMAIGKLLLLMCAGIVSRCSGSTALTRLGGLAPRLPVTAIGFIVGGLSIAGYPPFGGFASRWILLNVAGKYQGVLAAWIVVVSVLLLLAYARVFRRVFLGQAITRKVNREPFLPSLLILGLSLAILAIGVYPSPLFGQIQTALASVGFPKIG